MAISFRSVVNKALARYALAVVTVAASFLFRFALVRYFGLEFPPFTTFFPAIIFVAVLAGFWPGMRANALIVSGIIAAPRDAIALAMFAVISVFLSLLACLKLLQAASASWATPSSQPATGRARNALSRSATIWLCY